MRWTGIINRTVCWLMLLVESQGSPLSHCSRITTSAIPRSRVMPSGSLDDFLAAVADPERAILESADDEPTDVPVLDIDGLALTRWAMCCRSMWWQRPAIVMQYKVITYMETPRAPLGEWLSFVPMSFNMCGVRRPHGLQLPANIEAMIE